MSTDCLFTTKIGTLEAIRSFRYAQWHLGQQLQGNPGKNANKSEALILIIKADIRRENIFSGAGEVEGFDTV